MLGGTGLCKPLWVRFCARPLLDPGGGWGREGEERTPVPTFEGEVENTEAGEDPGVGEASVP